MQPSAKWKTITPFISATTGINERTGAVDFSDTDFTTYPPFTTCVYPGAGGQDSNMFWWYTNGDFPLNTPIDDWSIAYTAVDNSELSLNNIGVFMSNPDDPAFYTENRDYAPIAFYTSLGYKIIFDNIGGTPFLNDAFRFKNPPYSDSRYVWSPNAGGAMYEGDLGIFYRDANTEGYAAMLATFGVKSMFLEIRVRPVNISGASLALQDYSLKEYAAFTEQQRRDNPITNAYCMVHRRAATNGTYSQVNNFYTDINLVMGQPLKGYSSDIYTYFNSVRETYNIETLYLPLWGIPFRGRVGNYIRYCDGNYSDPKGQNTSDFFYGYDKVDGTVVQNIGGGEYHYIKYMLGTEENFEYLRKCAAAYGLFFCDDLYTSENKSLESSEYESDDARWLRPEMRLGIIEEDGYTRGRYTSGSENANQAQFNWTDSTDSNFDPGVRPDTDPNHYETSTPLPSDRLTIGAANCWTDVTLGSITPTMIVNNAIDAITDLAASVYTDETDALTAIANRERLKEFGFQEPLQTILDYRRIFLAQPHQRASSSTPIILGRFTSLDPNKPFVGYDNFSLFRRETLGSFTFWRTYKNFLDFEPYTQASLYVPFCGMKQLPMNIFMGHTVNIYLNACNLTGELEVLIFVDNMEWGTMQGIAAEELPLTANNAMTAAQEIRNLQYQQDMASWQGAIGMAGSIAGASISAANRNPTGLIAQGVTAALKYHSMQRQTNELQYKIDHTKPEITAIQKGAPTIESINVLTPFILLQTPVITGGSYDDVKKKYGKTKGFKCCVSGNLGDFNGLTVCSTANLDGISCTYTEKQMILEALQEGVILDWE